MNTKKWVTFSWYLYNLFSIHINTLASGLQPILTMGPLKVARQNLGHVLNSRFSRACIGHVIVHTT